MEENNSGLNDRIIVLEAENEAQRKDKVLKLD